MKLFVYLSLIIFLFSCKNKTEEHKNYIDPSKYEENLERVNFLMTNSEETQINDYIERKGWNMLKTGTGLRYWIYKKGFGDKIEKMSIVKFDFKVELINGYVCYDSKDNGSKEIQIGHSDLPVGLEEGLMMMRVGDRAKLILPSHLAYGLLGDKNKIPHRAILIYDIEILEKIK